MGYLYQQNNPASFSGLLVEDGHISQQSLSRYFGDTKIGRKHVFGLYNPTKSFSFLFLWLNKLNGIITRLNIRL